MEYILGIDQGGSKTYVIVADETGKILGLGRSYGACHSEAGLDYALQAISDAASMALGEAGLQKQDISTVVGGLTGIDWDYEAVLLKNAVEQLFPHSEVNIVNDCIIAMKAATGKRQCAILCAGSGLNCAVQNGEKCFTYGFYIPDEYQGGCSLGKAAVQAVFDSHMGLREETSLTNRLLELFEVATVDDLLYKRVNGEIGEKDYLKLPLILEELACAGDKVSGDIWRNYGSVIANYLKARMAKMGMLEAEADIVLSGSIFKCSFREFQDVVKLSIAESLPNARIIEAEYEPIVGALVMGLQFLKGNVTEMMYKNIRDSSGKYPLRRLRN